MLHQSLVEMICAAAATQQDPAGFLRTSGSALRRAIIHGATERLSGAQARRRLTARIEAAYDLALEEAVQRLAPRH